MTACVTGQEGGAWGSGGGESATDTHCPAAPPRMFHLTHFEQKPKVLIHFYSYQSREGENISGRKTQRGPGSQRGPLGPYPCPYDLTGLRQHVRTQGRGPPQPGTAAPPTPSQP